MLSKKILSIIKGMKKFVKCFLYITVLSRSNLFITINNCNIHYTYIYFYVRVLTRADL